MGDASLTVAESFAGRAPESSTTRVHLDEPVTVGRAGKVRVGVRVPDGGVSRVVATVTATSRGWTIWDTSRNGLVIRPWGLAPLRASTEIRLHWPLIGVRVLGAQPDARHWLHLECARYAVDGVVRRTGTTVQADPPRPLTPAEQEALAVVFGDVLAWPPPQVPREPLQLKQAGRRLDVTASAVKVRLEGARAKAELLGLDRSVGVTDPAYLHVLVAAGYVPLPPPSGACPAPEQD